MKIEIEIPDIVIAEGRTIHVMAGIERVAYKLWNQPWRVKTSRCSMCGKCCEALHCTHLEINRECGLGAYRGFNCCTGEPHRISGCTSLYEEVK